MLDLFLLPSDCLLSLTKADKSSPHACPDFSPAQSALAAQNTCIISRTSAAANTNSKQLDVRKDQIYHGLTRCVASAAIKLLVGQQKQHPGLVRSAVEDARDDSVLLRFTVVIYGFGC